MQVCRERRECVLDTASLHPVGIEHLLHFYPGIEKTYQDIAKMRKRKLLKHIGTAQINDNGRPVDMYFNGKAPESDTLVHEYHLTTFCLCYPDATWKRLRDTDRKLRPDAEMNDNYFVELDMGTVRSHTAIKKRFRVYEGQSRSVLWVCVKENRMEKLLELCQQWHDAKQTPNPKERLTKEDMYFTTLERVINDPFGDIWIDVEGFTCHL